MKKISGSTNKEYLVVLANDSPGSVPTCTCATFSNVQLPCRHIAAALYARNSSIKSNGCQFFDIENIPLRWRLTTHPVCALFQKPSAKETSSSNKNDTEVEYCSQPDLTKIIYPKQSALRHSRLSEICLPVIEEGKQSEYAYKIVMTYLTKAANGIKTFLQTDGTGDCMEYIIHAPYLQNAAKKNYCNTDTTNHANRRQKRKSPSLKPRVKEVKKGKIQSTSKQSDVQTDATNNGNSNNYGMSLNLPPHVNEAVRKRKVQCAACRYYQGVTVFDHQEYPTKCPHRFNPNHHKKPKEAEHEKKNM